MKRPPTHPLNPCRWSDDGDTPKLWELLRRNVVFRRWTSRLVELGQLSGQGVCGKLDRAKPLLDRVALYNPFAAYAAQWFFAPFVHRPKPKRCKLSALDVDQVEHWLHAHGWTPSMPVKESRALKKKAYEVLTYVFDVRRGHPSNIGPYLTEHEAAELHAWQSSRAKFSLDLAWPETPPLFQRKFAAYWRKFNPAKADSNFGLRCGETHFFQGWSFRALLNRYRQTVELANEIIARGKRPVIKSRPTKDGNHLVTELLPAANISATEIRRALEFDELAQDYRVFVFPKNVRLTGNRTKLIHDAFTKMANQVIRDCVKPNDETFGSLRQWDVFLYVGASNKSAFEDRLKDAYQQINPHVKRIDISPKWRKERLNYIDHFKAVEALIRSQFPLVKAPS